jgi:hypothetical protein
MRPHALLLVVFAAACGGDDGGPTGPTTGALEIRTTTTGQIPNGGYTYRVDGEPAQYIAAAAMVTRPELEPGSHVVALAGLPDGCTAITDNPQTISITPGSTTTVSFAVNCVPPVGTIQVVTATSGATPDSYELMMDGTGLGSIGSSTTRSLEAIPSGGHSIGLGALPANCQLQGENPQVTTVRTGTTVTVLFTIICTPPPPESGTLNITTTTTGSDPDGYQVTIDGGARQAIGANGSIALINVAAGSHLVRLSGLADGCAMSGANPRSVSVVARSAVAVTFTITCTPQPTTGSLQVVTMTTGSELDPDGYTFSLDGQAPQPVADNAPVILASVATGSHTVALSSVAGNCAVDGGNPRSVTVTGGATTEVSFAISCAPVPAAQWSQMESGTSHSLYEVWGSSGADVFAIGEPGGSYEAGIFHYDGQGWSEALNLEGATLYGLWGSGSTDVFAVGSSPLGTLGYDGVVLHFDGTSWTAMEGPGVGTEDGAVSVSFYSVWGTSGTSVFAVGESNAGSTRALIAHYDGTSWSDMTLAARNDRVLIDVYGTSDQDVYAVGYFEASANLRRGGRSFSSRGRTLSEGLLLHYDGIQWSEIALTGANLAFSGVWASGPNDVFAVGASDDHAMIYHFDGTDWAPMPVPLTGPLLDVWGFSGSDVYAVGVGTILHYDGQSWTEVQAVPHRLAGVWGSSPTSVFAVGSSGTILLGGVSPPINLRR